MQHAIIHKLHDGAEARCSKQLDEEKAPQEADSWIMGGDAKATNSCLAQEKNAYNQNNTTAYLFSQDLKPSL